LLQLVAAAGYRVWLPWGNVSERERAGRIAAGIEAASVLPRLNLRELADRLLRVQAVVAVDTGLGHLGAALDVPAVSLYGPTSTRLVGAYGRHQVHLQSSPGAGRGGAPHTMMASISAAAVWAELRTILPGDP
jgi:heptosyltransferase-1